MCIGRAGCCLFSVICKAEIFSVNKTFSPFAYLETWSSHVSHNFALDYAESNESTMKKKKETNMMARPNVNINKETSSWDYSEGWGNRSWRGYIRGEWERQKVPAEQDKLRGQRLLGWGDLGQRPLGWGDLGQRPLGWGDLGQRPEWSKWSRTKARVLGHLGTWTSESTHLKWK